LDRSREKLRSIQQGKEEKKIPKTIKRKTANWIGHILRRNCMQRLVIKGMKEGRIEARGRLRRKRKKPLDDLN